MLSSVKKFLPVILIFGIIGVFSEDIFPIGWPLRLIVGVSFGFDACLIFYLVINRKEIISGIIGKSKKMRFVFRTIKINSVFHEDLFFVFFFGGIYGLLYGLIVSLVFVLWNLHAVLFPWKLFLLYYFFAHVVGNLLGFWSVLVKTSTFLYIKSKWGKNDLYVKYYAILLNSFSIHFMIPYMLISYAFREMFNLSLKSYGLSAFLWGVMCLGLTFLTNRPVTIEERRLVLLLGIALGLLMVPYMSTVRIKKVF